MARKRKTSKMAETEPQAIEELAYRVEDGQYLAKLPSGKRLVIRPVHPAVIRRLLAAYPEPQPPKVEVEVEGTGLAQRFEKRSDPDYQRKLGEWSINLASALLTRFVLDAIVVPEDDEWAWKLKETGVPVPQNGADRQWAYVEEAHIELLEDPDEQAAFLKAVRQISLPTEAGIEAARRRFRDEVEGRAARGPEASAE